MNTEHTALQDRLERLAGAQLSRLPSLRAPATLETRVLTAIAAQSAPWHARGFRHWPLWAQTLFVLVAALVAYWISGQSVSVFNGAQATLATHGSETVADVGGWLNVLRALGRTYTAMFRIVPGSWLLLGVGAIFTCYATLLAGGVFAYRTISKV
jgi:hypothetical protein